MVNFYDIVWGAGVGIGTPYWLIKQSAREKVVKAFRQRMGRDIAAREGDAPCILIHAVSLGEMNATRALVANLQSSRPDLHIIVSTTTNTGYDRGLALYANSPNISLIRFPLDLSPAIDRLLDRLRPDLVVLLELEVWPNFILRASRRRIPVVVINGRLTTSSFRNYRLAGPLVNRTFARLALVAAQDQTYADRFIAVGANPDRVVITGTMKFDNAQVTPHVAGSSDLAKTLDLLPGDHPIWVCGSTGPGEEAIILRVYRDLLLRIPTLRLVLVPRHPERFDEACQLVHDANFTCIRRSDPTRRFGNHNPHPPVIIGDTMGELRKLYALADVILVARSLVDLGPRQHGSDMIEPAALGKPIIVGKYTANFADAMSRFRTANAIVEVTTEDQLKSAVARLLEDPAEAQALGQRAANVVRENQGATDRNARIILEMLDESRPSASPAATTSPVVVGGP